jgi:AcrR family transcriptional regulator
MRRDSQETRRSIFDAATVEFAEHGIAGARVDRIATSAGANKQLIYVHFGSKRKLFEAVVAEHVRRFMEAVPFDAADLPEWVGNAYDFFVAHPEVAQLGAWHALEPGESKHRIAAIEDAIAHRTRAIRRAQAQGIVASSVGAAELLAVVNALARTWVLAPPERNPPSGPDPRSVKRRRAAVVETTRGLVTPAAELAAKHA